jgi:NTE family protein
VTRTAIVLGAGGITGVAWLLGALEALHEHTGWDPATAEVVAGTSAGAAAAALLVAGVPSEAPLAMAEDQSVLDAAIARATGGLPGRSGLPRAWPGSLALGLTGLLATHQSHRAGFLTGFLPRGSRPCDEIRGLVHAAARDGRPVGGPLRIHACDYGSGRRVTFGGAGAPDAPLGDAVAASAAVPGYYRPVRIGDREYVDGGVHSFTNLDALADEDVDVVICLAPFSSRSIGGPADTALLGGLRRAVSWQLAREAEQLRRQGTTVVVVEPASKDLRAMGANPMDRSRSRRALETARQTLPARLERLLDGVLLPTAPAAPPAVAA